MTTRRTLLCAMAAAGALLAGGAYAQSNTPIKMLVGFSPGGPGDFTVRLLAEKMSASLNRPVIVQSVPGAGSQIALQQLKRSAPDGNTLLFVSNSLFTIYPQIYPKIDYDPVKDFTPIAAVAKYDNAIATGPATGAKTLAELMTWMKSHRSQVSFGTPGAGSLPHILGTALANNIGVSMVHIPYKSTSSSVVDLVGGRIPLLITSAAVMVEMHRAGKIRVVAVSSDERQPLLPDVPTLKEAGYDMSMVITNGVFAPANMAPELVKQLNTAIVDAINLPDVRKQLLAQGVFPAPSSPKEFADALVAESKRLQPTIATMGPITD